MMRNTHAPSLGAVLQPLALRNGKARDRIQTGPTVKVHTLRLGDVIQMVWKMSHVGNV